jgi:rhamnosyltransferase subunit B
VLHACQSDQTLTHQRHFILSPLGSGGDVYPLIALGRVLKARGCAVTVVTMDYFTKSVQAAGLEVSTYGSMAEFDELVADPRLWKPFEGTRLVFDAAIRYAREAFDAITAVKRESSVILAPATHFGARLAREKWQMPLVTVHLQPISMLSAGDFPVLHLSMAWMRRLPLWMRKVFLRLPSPMNVLARPRLRKLCSDVGVDAPRRMIPDWWHSPDGNLALFPAEIGLPQLDWPPNTYQHTFPLEDLAKEQPLSAELETFLKYGSKPIAFTAGTGNRHAREFFASAAQAAERLGQRAILCTRHLPDVPEKLPDGVMGCEYAPFSLLLPHCSALVHHGGIGTLSQAWRAGIPQLITPLAHDQPDNAVRVRERGIGDYLPIQTALQSELLAAALTKLLPLIIKTRPPADKPTDELVEWLLQARKSKG